MYKTIRQFNLFLNSRSRNSGTISDCIIKLPPSLVNITDKEKIRLTMVDFVCNHSHYNIQTYNSSFNVIEFNPSKTYTITIPDGNYTISEISAIIKGLLNGESSKIWNISYDRNINKLTFSYSIGDPVQIDFNIDNTCAEILGFNEEIYYFTTNLTSVNVACVSSEEAIYVRFPNLMSSNFEIINDGEVKISDVLCKIPLNTMPFSNIFYKNDSYLRSYSMIISERKIEEFHIRLTNENDVLLNLSREWTCCLLVEILEENTMENLLSSFDDYLKFIVLNTMKNKIS